MSGEASHQIVTALYVPGNRPDRFEKAVGSGADMVIIDLEDAVAPDAKSEARAATAEWLEAHDWFSGPRVQVRVNAASRDDLVMLRATRAPIEVRVPKVEYPHDLDDVAAITGDIPLTALIESARGVQNAADIADHSAVTRLALGESDLASNVGSADPALLDYARVHLLFAAKATGLPAPMLSAYVNIPDLDGLRADTERGRRLGCIGRVAIHPGQLATIAEVFAPRAPEVAWAQAVLASATGGVHTLASGEMVDDALIGRAKRILEAYDDGLPLTDPRS